MEEKKVGDGEEKEVESLPEKNLSAPLVSYESQVRQKKTVYFENSKIKTLAFPYFF